VSARVRGKDSNLLGPSSRIDQKRQDIKKIRGEDRAGGESNQDEAKGARRIEKRRPAHGMHVMQVGSDGFASRQLAGEAERDALEKSPSSEGVTPNRQRRSCPEKR